MASVVTTSTHLAHVDEPFYAAAAGDDILSFRTPVRNGDSGIRAIAAGVSGVLGIRLNNEASNRATLTAAAAEASFSLDVSPGVHTVRVVGLSAGDGFGLLKLYMERIEIR